jgi:hypothetical protein
MIERLKWIVKPKVITSSAVTPSARPWPLKARMATATSRETHVKGDAREAIRQPERDLLSDIGDRVGPAIGGDTEGAHEDPGGDAEGVADHGRAERQHDRRGEQGRDHVEVTEHGGAIRGVGAIGASIAAQTAGTGYGGVRGGFHDRDRAQRTNASRPATSP